MTGSRRCCKREGGHWRTDCKDAGFHKSYGCEARCQDRPREKLCDGASWRCGQIVGMQWRYSKIDCNNEQRAESCKFWGPKLEVEKKDARNQRGSDVLHRKPAVNAGTKRLHDRNTVNHCRVEKRTEKTIKKCRGWPDVDWLSGSCWPDTYRLSGSWLLEIWDIVDMRRFDSALGNRWAKVNVGRRHSMKASKSDGN